MKFNKFKLVFLKTTLIVFLSFFVTISLYSQDCPNTNNGIWNYAEGEFNPRKEYNLYGVQYLEYPIAASGYEWSQYANIFNIKVSWRSGFQLNVDPLYEFTDEESKNLVILGIIQERLGGFLICDRQNNLNNNVYTFNFYETVNCETEKTCYLKLNQDLRIFCRDAAFPEDEVPSYQNNYIFYFPYKKKVICGTTCCVTTYTVKCETQTDITDMIGASKRLVIQSKIKHSNECAVSTNIDCHSSQTIPCTAKCAN